MSDRYERAACGLLTVDPFDRITGANRTFCEWTGFSVSELVGRQFASLLTAGSQLFFETRCQAVLRLEGQLREVALNLTKASGEPLATLTNASATLTDAGDLIEVQFAVFDATRRQDYEREMLVARRAAESSESRVRLLQDATSLFLTAASDEDLALALAETARRAFVAADTAVVLLSPDGSELAAVGTQLTNARLIVPAILAANSASATFTGLSDPGAAEQFSPVVAGGLGASRLKAASVATLHDGTHLLGALFCFYGRERQFDEAVGELHLALARQAAAAVVRSRLERQLLELAMHDQLTGLANRNLLSERISHAIATSARNGLPLALLFLDLDGFKSVNDQLGHRVGDLVLRSVASRIDKVVREADIAGRHGGDEFLIVCENADEATARLVAERIRQAIRLPLADLPGNSSLTTSIGAAIYQPSISLPPTIDDLIRTADSAMYLSKAAGGDQLHVSVMGAEL